MKPIRFYLIALVIIICDQISKWAVVKYLPFQQSVDVIGKYVSLTYTHNTGGAFSLLQTRNGIFIVVAAVAIVVITYAYHRFQRGDLLVSAALALALGGAIGNMIDRVRFHYVIDFFDVHFWPVFNIADSAISIGIVLLVLRYISHREPAPSPAPPSAPEAPAKNDHVTE